MTAETTTPEPRKSRVAGARVEWLDALRGLAAFTVLLGHGGCMLWTTMDGFYSRTLHVGHVAVISFFAISGYVIPMSMERSPSLQVFWIRRFWRLYPAYGVTLVMAVGLVAAGRSVPNQGEPSLLMLPLDLAMIRGSVSAPIVAGAWTLWVEMVFYGLVSLMWISGLNKRPAAVAWSLMFLSFGLRRYAPGLNLLTGGYHSWELLLYLAIMSVGTCLHRLDRGELRPVYAYGTLAGLLLLLARIVQVSAFDPYAPARYVGDIRWEFDASLTGDPHAPARLMGVVVFLLARQLCHVEIPRLFLWLGRISYSLYLVHPVVIAGIGPVGPRPLTLLVWVAVSLVVAALSYRFIEAPAERLGRSLTSSSRVRPAGAPTSASLAVEAG